MAFKEKMKKRSSSFKIYDAYENKEQAQEYAKDLMKSGSKAEVRKITPQAGGRLKYGVFTNDIRLV